MVREPTIITSAPQELNVHKADPQVGSQPGRTLSTLWPGPLTRPGPAAWLRPHPLAPRVPVGQEWILVSAPACLARGNLETRIPGVPPAALWKLSDGVSRAWARGGLRTAPPWKPTQRSVPLTSSGPGEDAREDCSSVCGQPCCPLLSARAGGQRGQAHRQSAECRAPRAGRPDPRQTGDEILHGSP